MPHALLGIEQRTAIQRKRPGAVLSQVAARRVAAGARRLLCSRVSPARVPANAGPTEARWPSAETASGQNFQTSPRWAAR